MSISSKAWASLLALALSASALAAQPLNLTAAQMTAADWALRVASRYRYKAPVPQSSSVTVLDRYFHLLDREKIFFTSADCTKLAAQYPSLNQVQAGADMAKAAAIFERLQARQEEFLAYAMELLNAPVAFARDEMPLENPLPEARPASDETMKEAWRKLVRNDRLKLHLSGMSPDAVKDSLSRRYSAYLAEQRKATSADVFEQFMNAYLFTLDPHINYFPPRMNAPQPRQVNRGRPSLFSEDKDAAATNQNAAKAVAWRIAAPATGGRNKPVGIIKILNFNEDFEARKRGDKDYASAAREVERALAAMKEAGVSGVLLDMRDNVGGGLQVAFDVAGLFLGSRTVLQSKNFDGRVEIHRTSAPGPAWDGPLVALLNSRSAGGTEILAAALQDYGRGVIVGDSSYGYGTVAVQVNLDRFSQDGKTGFGELKLTTAQYYRVTGSSLQRRGVTPDIQLPRASIPGAEREVDFPTALPWGEIAPVDIERFGNLPKILPELSRRHQARRTGAAPAAKEDLVQDEAVAILQDLVSQSGRN
jgi:C-terminal processing protease CtpA/Prc